MISTERDLTKLVESLLFRTQVTENNDNLLTCSQELQRLLWRKRKEIVTMKKLNLKVKPEKLLTIGTLALGAAQLLLSNKKEASDRANMKAEILSELKETIDK